MRRSPSLLPALLALLLCLSGCGPKGPTQVVIRLPGDETTGYAWTYALDAPQVLAQMHAEYQAAAAGQASQGAEGTYVWTFMAMHAGTAQLQFECAKPGEAGEPSAQVTYTLTVDGDGYLTFDGMSGSLEGLPVPELVVL